MTEIVRLDARLAAKIPSVSGGPGWNGGDLKWKRYWKEHLAGYRVTLVALAEEEPVGYGSLLRQSAYRPFSEARIPEINDLAVARAHRRRGIGRSLIFALERCAVDWGCREVGLGVGLYADYGAAQRLYVRLGYVPDGAGITHDNRPIPAGVTFRLDDEAVLWLTRRVAADPDQTQPSTGWRWTASS